MQATKVRPSREQFSKRSLPNLPSRRELAPRCACCSLVFWAPPGALKTASRREWALSAKDEGIGAESYFCTSRCRAVKSDKGEGPLPSALPAQGWWCSLLRRPGSRSASRQRRDRGAERTGRESSLFRIGRPHPGRGRSPRARNGSPAKASFRSHMLPPGTAAALQASQ